MKKILLFVALLVISSGAFAQKNTSQSYIQKFKDNAIRIMHESGVPASIVLAIAMHESGNGNSKIARTLNNHFGMKGRGSVPESGRKGRGSVPESGRKRMRSAYKQYDSDDDSFNDFARVMTEKKKFSQLAEKFTHYDYLGWVKGIQHSGYAASRKWGAQVLGLIHKYNLNELDEKPVADQQPAKNVE